MSYYLKLYDTTLIEFDMASSGRTLLVDILSIDWSVRHLFPIDWDVAEFSDDDVLRELTNWLKTRTIPSNRAYVKSFLSKMGVSQVDVQGILDICRGLSLNDSYWVCPSDSQALFSKMNLYENRFNRTLSYIAFTGVGDIQATGFKSTPELTTNGMLAKCWRRIDGTLYLFKEGSVGFANSGQEPFAEYYAYDLARQLGFDAVAYVPTKWKGHFCSKCELFTSKDIAFVSIGRLVKSGGIEAVSQFYQKLDEQKGTNIFSNAFADMLLFDALICNTDRHFGNFGVLVDSQTNKIIAPAPLFDHGLSLFQSAMQDDFDDINNYASHQLPRTYDDFILVAAKYAGPSQKAKLRQALTFTFEKHARYNWDEWRLSSLENWIHKQARVILEACE